MAIFKVAAHTGDNNNGYIEYDTETKELGVHLNDDAMDEKARQYLTTEKALHQYTDLSNYKTLSVVPTSSLEAFDRQPTTHRKSSDRESAWQNPPFRNCGVGAAQ